MALKRQMCVNHADRPAIAVCVITGKAICAECSTQYEGVNYSKEGLLQLQKQRAAAAAKRAGGRRAALMLSLLATPVLLASMVGFYYATFTTMIDVQQKTLRELIQED